MFSLPNVYVTMYLAKTRQCELIEEARHEHLAAQGLERLRDLLRPIAEYKPRQGR